MSRSVLKLVFLTWLLLAAAPVVAGQLGDAIFAYYSADYTKALRLLRPLAEQNEALAQYHLGLMHEGGKGVPQDYTKAATWYQKAAEQGNLKAKNSLERVAAKVSTASVATPVEASPIETVEQVETPVEATIQAVVTPTETLVAAPVEASPIETVEASVITSSFEDAVSAYYIADYTKAVRLFRRSADEGNADAQYQLGVMYEEGKGVQKDNAEAAKFYQKAATQGHAISQHNLGTMYATGQGVPKDSSGAVMWFQMAAEQGLAKAQNNLGFMYGTGQGVPQDLIQAYKWYDLAADLFPVAMKNRESIAAKMTPTQIAKAQKLAREWKLSSP